MTKRIGLTLLAALIGASALSAQNRTVFASGYNAVDFGYGSGGNTPPPLLIYNGNTSTTGAQTVTVAFGYTTLSDGTTIVPFNTNAPLLVGVGSNQETVTPSAVSCSTPQVYGSCTFTATFANQHGINEPVSSGTFGLQEAINAANSAGGGVIYLNTRWQVLGGTSAMITAAAAFPTVWVEDHRGGGLVAPSGPGFPPYWTMQRTTLSVVGVPATLSGTSVVFTSATGTWAASSTHFRRTFVDCMGQESAGSVDYTQTPTVNFTLTVTAPATQPSGGGACGWIMYAGTSSAAVSYRLPATTANCVLSTQETVIPACAMSAAGTWAATFTTTAPQIPVALGVTSSSNPVPQSAQTYGYQPSGQPPQGGFPVSYGPFGSGTIASATAGVVTPLGSVNLPTGFLNYIGRKVRLTGKIQGADTATGTLAILAGLTWSGTGITAGAPVPVCDTVSLSVLGTQTYSFHEDCLLVTNAASATNTATIQPDSFFIAGGTLGTTNIVASEFNQVAVTALNLAAQDVLTIYMTPTTEPVTAVQLMSLNIEVLQ